MTPARRWRPSGKAPTLLIADVRKIPFQLARQLSFTGEEDDPGDFFVGDALFRSRCR